MDTSGLQPEELTLIDIVRREYRLSLRSARLRPLRMVSALALGALLAGANLLLYGYFVHSQSPFLHIDSLITITHPWFHHQGPFGITKLCIGMLLVLFLFPLSSRRLSVRLGFAALLAGALANLISAFYWKQGVPDFIWLDFLRNGRGVETINSGDMCIFGGVLTMAVSLYRSFVSSYSER